MSRFEKYFSNEFSYLQEPRINLDSLLESNMLLIHGDFYGIQKFIFDKLDTKNAGKVLRAKSAFIQIFTETLAKFICFKLNIDERYILTTNAGKFEILSPNIDTEISQQVQKIVDSYFIQNFYGLSGVSICTTLCKKEDFQETTNYRKLRDKVASTVEEKKFFKFNLPVQSSVLEYNESITNQTLCRICCQTQR